MERGELVPDDIVLGMVEERHFAAGLRERVCVRRFSAHAAAGGKARRGFCDEAVWAEPLVVDTWSWIRRSCCGGLTGTPNVQSWRRDLQYL